MKRDVTVCIPSIPPRRDNGLLDRALRSVYVQTHPVDAISVAVDNRRLGAARTRQRALEQVNTTWVAFLDDDDEFMQSHVEDLLTHAEEMNADYVYSWFEVIGGHDPFPARHFTDPYDPAVPVGTTVTILVKTELAKTIGFDDLNRHETQSGEDWRFQMGCQEAGAKISHLARRTWYWHHDSRNTSGLPTRW